MIMTFSRIVFGFHEIPLVKFAETYLINYVFLIVCSPLLGALYGLFASWYLTYGDNSGISKKIFKRKKYIFFCTWGLKKKLNRYLLNKNFVINTIIFSVFFSFVWLFQREFAVYAHAGGRYGWQITEIVKQPKLMDTRFSWIKIFDTIVDYSFTFDLISLSMATLVLSVSLIVCIFSKGYLSGDPSLIRFMSYLSLFTFFMLVLIFSSNFLVLFIGWEGVGICSYLLISFWSTRLEAVKSAFKAVIINKIGDFFLFIGIIITYNFFSCLEYRYLNYMMAWREFPLENFTITILNKECQLIFIICFFFFIGIIGKSAQIGLHVWLPDAMEGPTPVSALIHAATMVTAGIFLIIRCHLLFNYSPNILIILVIFGSLTAILAGSIALVQTDLKKIIAYSTCSQLGYMLLSCGLSGYKVAFYHLLNHGFFKALLFLSAGLLIHIFFDDQDLRKVYKWGVWLSPKIALWFILIGTLSITGFPGFSGFFSKDMILELAYSNRSYVGFFGFFFGTLTVFVTSFYSYRLLYLIFFNESMRFYKNSLINNNWKVAVKEIRYVEDKKMVWPLYILAFGSIFSGYLIQKVFFLDLFSSRSERFKAGSGYSGYYYHFNIVFPESYDILLFEMEFIPLWVKILPTICSILGLIIAHLFLDLFFLRFIHFLYHFKFIYFLLVFLFKKWNFDKLYNLFSLYILKFSYKFLIFIEKGFLEYFILENIVNFFKMVSGFFSKVFNSGNLYFYSQFYFFIISFFLLIFNTLLLDKGKSGLYLWCLFFEYIFNFIIVFVEFILSLFGL